MTTTLARRAYFDDEEPETTWIEPATWAEATRGLCRNCGQKHKTADCPHVGAEVYPT